MHSNSAWIESQNFKKKKYFREKVPFIRAVVVQVGGNVKNFNANFVNTNLYFFVNVTKR